VTGRNLRLCFPGLEARGLRRLTESSLCQTAMLLLEAGVTLHGSEAAVDRLVGRVRGAHAFHAALEAGTGVLLLVPHYGNWELLNLYLGRYRLAALFDPPRHGAIDLVLRRARQRTGSRLLPITLGGLRQAYRTLSNGGVLAVLPDQVPERASGLHVPFFGRPALTMTLAHRLIQRCRPEVLVACARRTPAGFDVEFTRPAREVLASAPCTALAAMNREIEKLILKDPSQYQWEYARFKSPRRGDPRPY